MPFDLAGKRVLVFVVAYNAENTIKSVLSRIPAELRQPNLEVLVIDDFSKDRTFHTGLTFHEDNLKVTMLRTPENQGYGGNQKLGYRYAIDHGFDVVALVHGDGQYAPEKLPSLLEPLLKEEADAVFGSRMINKSDALKGGMPLYKWVGNQVLTNFQNWLLGTNLSEFHSGYRLYSVAALKQIPFERNSNDFHFDTEIIVQLVLRGLHIEELPIPTFYGDEICHVNGMKYAWDVVKTMIGCRIHQRGIFYDRRFDVTPSAIRLKPELPKLEYPSSHTFTLAAAKPGEALLWGDDTLAEALALKGVKVEKVRNDHLPEDVSHFDQILLLDVIEHLQNPELFVEQLRHATTRSRPEVILTTPNVAFFITRFMLLLGQFNYSQRGILDLGHTRLFTFKSLNALIRQAGYKVLEVRGIPAPYPKSIGNNWLSRTLVKLNEFLIRIAPGVFSYQIYLRAKAQPTVKNLLAETIDKSEELRKTAEL
jgi:glycosyltransferase involved in cell wall biosynthesis